MHVLFSEGFNDVELTYLWPSGDVLISQRIIWVSLSIYGLQKSRRDHNILLFMNERLYPSTMKA